jgi:hypothetical protein
MRRTKRASPKRSRSVSKAQNTFTKVGLYQQAATPALNPMTSRSVGDLNDGFRQVTDEMSAYSVRSIEQVFHAWKQFLDTGPLRQVVELQTRYAQNASIAYEAYVDGVSKLGEVYLNVSRRVAKPLSQGPRRAK